MGVIAAPSQARRALYQIAYLAEETGATDEQVILR